MLLDCHLLEQVRTKVAVVRPQMVEVHALQLVRESECVDHTTAQINSASQLANQAWTSHQSANLHSALFHFLLQKCNCFATN